MVLLVGNYPLDRQQSMQRFGTMMLDGLSHFGITAKLIAPHPFFGRFRGAGMFVAKWLGKGRLVHVSGRLQSRTWEAADGSSLELEVAIHPAELLHCFPVDRAKVLAINKEICFVGHARDLNFSPTVTNVLTGVNRCEMLPL